MPAVDLARFSRYLEMARLGPDRERARGVEPAGRSATPDIQEISGVGRDTAQGWASAHRRSTSGEIEMSEPRIEAEEEILVPEYYKVLPRGANVGIEVELEGRGGDVEETPEIPGWFTEGDGSLRDGGVEYISRHPLAASQLGTALTELYNHIGEDFSLSPRTSIHVHVGAEILAPSSRRRMVLAYYILEPLIFDWIGEGREGSAYCKTLSYWPTVRQSVREYLRSENLQGSDKYTALNLRSLGRLNTFEFRSLGATGDIQRVGTWVAMLMELFSKALAGRGSPETLLESLAGEEAGKVVQRLLPVTGHFLVEGREDRLDRLISAGIDTLLKVVCPFHAVEHAPGMNPEFVNELIKSEKEY